MFADDLGCLFSFKKSSKQMVNKINNYLNKLEKWLFKWRMKMNVDKCNYIIFGSSRLKPEFFQFTFKEKLIPYSNNPIFLSVTLDENLNFAAHFENLGLSLLFLLHCKCEYSIVIESSNNSKSGDQVYLQAALG